MIMRIIYIASESGYETPKAEIITLEPKANYLDDPSYDNEESDDGGEAPDD